MSKIRGVFISEKYMEFTCKTKFLAKTVFSIYICSIPTLPQQQYQKNKLARRLVYFRKENKQRLSNDGNSVNEQLDLHFALKT